MIPNLEEVRTDARLSGRRDYFVNIWVDACAGPHFTGQAHPFRADAVEAASGAHPAAYRVGYRIHIRLKARGYFL